MVIVTVLTCIVSIAVSAVLSLLVIFLIATGVDALVDWIKSQRLARIDRAEAELDRTQEQLRATMLQLADALGQEAHEARKALIRESFLASGHVPPQE